MRVIDTDFNNILLDKNSYKNSLIYNISYKTFMGEKPSHIWFNKIDGFIKIDNVVRYLGLLKFNEVYERIKFLISEKSGITDSINYNFARIRIDSYNSLPIEKILTFDNVAILIKSVVNENKNHYYYNIFLEKGSNKHKSNTQYF